MKFFLSLFFLILISSPSQAALVEIQHINNHVSGGVTSFSTTITATGSGNLLVVAIWTFSPLNSVTSVTDGTSNFVEVPGAYATNAGHGFAMDVWYLPRSSGGKTSITANISTANGTSSEASMEVWEVSGFKNPVLDKAGVVNNGVGSGAKVDTGAAVTTTSSTGFVIGAVVVGSGITANPKAGNEFTAGGDVDGGGNAFCSLISSTAASHQPVWTASVAADAFASSTASFKDGGYIMRMGGGRIKGLKLGI